MNLLKRAFVTAALTTAGSLYAAEIEVLSAFAVQEALTEIAPQFEKTSGHQLILTWSTSPTIRKQIADGKKFDLVITTSADLQKFIAEQHVASGSEVAVGRTGVAIAIPEGASKPDIGTPESLKNALLNAKGIGLSGGASGQIVLQMIDTMGILETVRPKLKEAKPGVRVAALLAGGEASLGFQQMSEFTHERGITILGYVPPSLQRWTVWASGISKTSERADASRTLQQFLAAATPVWKAHDIEPIPK